MRNLPSYISQRLNQNIQIRSNKTDINSKIWVSRPTTVLIDDQFLERQTVLNKSITDVSIAVCHPRANRSNTKIYIGYISDGQARVVQAKHKTKMSSHIWFDTGFVVNATAISVAFDGIMPRSYGSEVEFVTDYDPWIFWIDSSKLYAKKLGSGPSIDPFIMAETNCTDVSTIRAMWSNEGGFDFGLVAFFIVSGKLYYRQLINGEWMDAELVSYGPSGVTWEEVATFRTWDYRIGVQAKATNGTIYELYTQFMGVGKQNTEYFKVDVVPDAELIAIKRRNTKSEEHFRTDVFPNGTLIWGLTSSPVAARNVDNGEGNFGLFIDIQMDHPISNIEGNVDAFTMTDSAGNQYTCVGINASDDGIILRLEFVDFNLSAGQNLTISYTPGSVQSPAVPMEAFSFTFTPENLVAPSIGQPEVVRIRNLNSDGTKIAIEFTEAIIGDLNGNADKFTVTMDEYDMVPGGTIFEVTRAVTDVQMYSGTEELIDLSSGSLDGIDIHDSIITLAQNGGT